MTKQYALYLMITHGARDKAYIQCFGTALLRESVRIIRARRSSTKDELALADAVEQNYLRAEGKC